MLSLCLTNYNRYEMLLESFQHVYDDPRITEIVISDDCSDIKIYRKLEAFCKDRPKIKLFRNDKNVGMSLNKKLAIERATEDWCILLDSDNIIKPDYIDAVYEIAATPPPFGVSKKCIYCPEFAKPEFDYRKFSGYSFNAKEAKDLMSDKVFNMLMNTCNYIVHREQYLKVYQHNPSIKASDTIHFNYLWLKSGGSFYVVPGMQYFHRVHSGSGFLADTDYNLRKAEETKKLILQL
jgi:glycosyltransferase involved in cell wall biosynthesis